MRWIRSPLSTTGVGETMGEGGRVAINAPRPLPSAVLPIANGEVSELKIERQHCWSEMEKYPSRVIFDEITEVLDATAHPAAMNMAIDELLLRDAATPLLRIYRWAHPAVSFGYFGKVAVIRASWPEREPVRRWTGGGVVLHGDDFTYTLIVPRGATFFSLSLSESYRAIHEQIASLLPGAQFARASEQSGSGECFDHAVEHDLIVAGRKVAGAAQRRTVSGLLHQGSVQLGQKNDALRKGLAVRFARRVHARLLSKEELERARLLAGERYGSREWLERR